MFYPGMSAPLPTIRLANVRDGVQDYELMKLAEERSGREKVLEVVRKILPDQAHPNRNRRDLRRAWLELVKIASAPTE
jgi:hypothetical protein